MIAWLGNRDVAKLAISLVVLTTLPTLAAARETPESFVRRVYARYKTVNSPGVPMGRPGGAVFYTTALLDAFAKDAASADGETGAIDADPICVCQTNGPLRIRTVTMITGAADTVQARVTFDYLSYISLHDAPQSRPETVLLTLSRTRAGWRIADIGNRTMTSLTAVLRESDAYPTQPDTTPQK